MSDTGQSLCALCRAAGLLFSVIKLTRITVPPKKPLAKIFAIARIFLAFCFSPRSVSRGDERPYRPSIASCRAGADAGTVHFLDLLFLLSEVE